MFTNITLSFLQDLKINNNKSWFDAHRSTYEIMRNEYKNCAAEILEDMQKIDSSLENIDAKECLFRINRDTRFSKNKAPYKTNLGVWLPPLGKKSGLAGYYLHIEPGGSFIGGGLYMPDSPSLQKLRKEIYFFYDEFSSILSDTSFSDFYGNLDMSDDILLKKCPRGFDINHPSIPLIKLKSFTATKSFDDHILIDKSQFKGWVIDAFVRLKPLISYINRGLLSNEEGGI